MTNRSPYTFAINPFVFFQSVTGDATNCRAHMRPYAELSADLTNHTVARFNFIAPGLCYDMHSPCYGKDSTRNGDDWLASEVPKIMVSPAYLNGGAIFITWDEGDAAASDGPIGMIVLSPRAKGGGYHNQAYYTHSSTLRTFQDFFGLQPYLGAAATAADLSDLFNVIHLTTTVHHTDRSFTFTVSNTVPGRTYQVQASSDLASANWLTLSTNSAGTNSFSVQDPAAGAWPQRFYRVLASP